MLDRVVSEQRNLARLKAEVREAQWRRNRAVRDAIRAGVDRKALAAAADLSPGRLSQILNHRSGHLGS